MGSSSWSGPPVEPFNPNQVKLTPRPGEVAELKNGHENRAPEWTAPIKAKLLDFLAKNEAMSPDGFATGFLVSEALSDSDMDQLIDWEKDIGEAGVNAWLVSVLVETGKYEAAGDGNIQLKAP